MRELPAMTDPERQSLEAFLEFHRQTLLAKCEGLSEEQLATRAVEPSALSLHGLVRHMADVERWWFQRGLGGRRVPMRFWTKEDPDADFEVPGDSWSADLEAYLQEVAESQEVASGMTLDEVVEGPRGGMTLRWVYLHMIAEYARHNGHADLLRERLDGSVGW